MFDDHALSDERGAVKVMPKRAAFLPHIAITLDPDAFLHI
jgi:hypothetical protein